MRLLTYRMGLRSIYRSTVPVVVIGNLMVGGTGKTPLTAWLATALKQTGFKPGILTRGYGSGSRRAQQVTSESIAAQVGDEPLMLACQVNVPVVLAPRRAEGAKLLESLGVEIILCDDGLQHYGLARDLEIAVFDGVRGLGNGHLLPAGPLRESLQRLDSVDFVVFNGVGDALAQTPKLHMQLRPLPARALIDQNLSRDLESFRGQTVHAVAAIGHPERFFTTLRLAGLSIIEHPFPDHAPLIPEDFNFGDTKLILMTAKDAVKCKAFADSRMWQVPVAVQLVPNFGQDLLDRIVALVKS